MAEELKVQEFFDKDTSTLSYIIYDSVTRDGVIVDSVLNYHPEDQSISYESIEMLLDFINSNKLKIHYILDTHIHADHFTGAALLKESLPSSQTGIGDLDETSRSYFKEKFPHFNDLPYDLLLKENEVLSAGSVNIEVLKTPGHTASCVSYKIGENIFTGDVIFIPDSGTGRCDFPGGDSEEMYHSIKGKLYSLPDHYNIYVGHDYSPNNREMKFKTTVKDELDHNTHLNKDIDVDKFVSMRSSRDKTLNSPRLLNESIYVNINGGDIRPMLIDNKKSIIKLEL